MGHFVVIRIKQQSLLLYGETGRCEYVYPISSARNGIGQRQGSEQTPLGHHIIRAKIGAGSCEKAVFVCRRWTGEVYSPDLGQKFQQRDWILSRILWLSGVEPGLNRLGDVDTMQRCIYIHGVPDEQSFRVPRSRGCINMRSRHVCHLFEQVALQTPVHITM